MPKSTKDDPYSFYSLENIKGNTRNWKLEIRLYDISYQIAQNVREYCIRLFRKIYSDIFYDNQYRQNYREKAIICGQDCEQILQNLCIVSKHKTFCQMFRIIIRKKCTMKLTENDKCNFTADDRLQKKMFDKETDNIEDMKSTVRQLFDNISNQDIDEFVLSTEIFSA